MAPTKTVKSRSSSKKKGQARNLKNLPATKAVLETSKVKRSKLHKTPSALGSVQKKKKIYTDKELGLPKLNMITPAGVNSPKGKKKGKVFADDQESMMTILAIVEATKEGQIESKLKKSRHLEEIREARRKELEAKQGHKNSKLEQTKDSLRESLRRKRKRKNSIPSNPTPNDPRTPNAISPTPGSGKKRVSFI